MMRPLICLALFVALAPSAGAATCRRHPDGLHLADGICATVFAQGVGPARHLAVRRNGDVFVPFRDGGPAGHWQVFADGFAGPGRIASPGDARYRPVGLAEGPDGALYVADSVRGRIWRFTSAPR